MVTIAYVGSMKISMYKGDHNPPHCHVYTSDGREGRFLFDGTYIEGRLKNKEIRLIASWMASNCEGLIEQWKNFQE